MYYKVCENNYDQYAGKLYAVFLILNILNIVIKQTLPGASFIPLITPMFGVIYILFFLVWGRHVKAAFRTIAMIEVVFILLVSLSLIRHSGSATAIIQRIIWTVSFCVPLGAIGFYVKDYKIFLKQTLLANNIAFACGIFSFLRTYMVYGGFTYENYNMELCYALLLPLFFHVYYAKEKKIYWTVAFVEFVIIAVYGSRGQLLCIALYALIVFIKSKNRSKKMLLVIIGAFVLVVGAIFANQLLNSFGSLVARFGSRTLSMLIRGNITYDSGRGQIWAEALEKVKDNPVIGMGVAGELSYLKSSPHNLFVEMMVHYGFFLGIIICLYVALLLFYLVSRRLNGEKEIIVIMASSVIPLMLSSTYLQTPGFWITIAMISSQTIYFRNAKIVVTKKKASVSNNDVGILQL